MDIDPAAVDISRANAARMYDYLLGGAHNFAVDREHVARLLVANPEVELLARANRAYLGRVVRWCLTRGVEQFLDLGSGVPTVGNVHEIAHQHCATARVAYVDNEPVAVAHSRQVVAELDHSGPTTVTVTQADLRDVPVVLGAPGVAGLLDFARPVAVFALSCLHFLPGDLQPVLDAYRRALPPGSVVALSHASADVDDPVVSARMTAMAQAFVGSASPQTLRTRAELRGLLGDYELVEPGIVDITCWPEPPSAASTCTGGLAAVAHAPPPGVGDPPGSWRDGRRGS